jgi:deazaflavin-dependent oxidoreductase (nitroreductase family)
MLGHTVGDGIRGTVPRMGLASDLGYARGRQNVAQRWVIALVSTRPVSALSRRVLPSLDRIFLRLTKGRSTLTSFSSGLPVLWLTTAGARTKEKRTVPLLGFPIGEDLAVLGTHFGSQATPGWVHNLEAEPHAEVEYRGRKESITARPADPDEAKEVWNLAAQAYPGYEHYAGRASHRVIRVFVLEATRSD